MPVTINMIPCSPERHCYLLLLLRKFSGITGIALCILLSFFPGYTTAQDEEQEGVACEKPQEKKAQKLFEQYKKARSSSERWDILKALKEIEPDFVGIYFEEAQAMVKKKSVGPRTIEYLQKTIELCPTYNAYAYYYLGDIYFGQEKYREATKYLTLFLKDADKVKSDEDYKRAERMQKEAKAMADLFDHPVPFTPSIVKNICTKDDEVLPIISPDGEQAFFTRRTEAPSRTAWESQNKTIIEKFTRSTQEVTGEYTTGDPMPSPFNQNQNEGGATISIDNKHLFFTVCKPDMTGYNNCDIYYSDFINGEWTEIKSIADTLINGKKTWEVQPTLASDGKTLYFVSIRKSNIGFTDENPNSDLYYITRNDSGKWSAPVNLGPAINTAGNEKSPFIHSDSHTLYFSSNGHPGVGGYDIFYSRADEKGIWKTPKNIGIPINTSADELSFFVSTDGKTAFFASTNLKGVGGWDLYSFELYKDARPEESFIAKGMVKNEKGEIPAGASVELKNMHTKEVQKIQIDSTDGTFAALIRKKDAALLTIKQPGTVFTSKYFSPQDSVTQVAVKFEMEVKPIEVGKPYVIHNINYATNRAELTEESTYILDEFAAYLTENTSLKVAIHGHTDNVGDDQSNLALSEDRAFTVRQYLQEKGVEASRLTSKGFGKNKPVASNDTEEGRASNRRTEFVVLSK